VVTAVRGRSEHLRMQLEGLARSADPVDSHVVVAMNDATVAQTVIDAGSTAKVVPLNEPSHQLPVAAARNLGAQIAIDAGAELLVFLDVDCIPAPNAIGRYKFAAEDSEHRTALLCGPVTYLPPQGPGRYVLSELDWMVDPHPARPVPPDDEVLVSTEYHYFWSLSFAITRSTWECVGGFCTSYTGYGGEDTDFAQLAAAQGISMRWVGGAHAFHQYHPISDPPIEHLNDILTNANIFHGRWGWWPMRGWLDEFERLGLIYWDKRGRPSLRRGTARLRQR
jgi:N-acetylglucosaminyl-diphospho-decaprenol L-rhamnosyltransferase